MMALPRNYFQQCLSLALTAIFIFSLDMLPPTISGVEEASLSSSNSNSNVMNYDEEMRKMVLGSRPPGCVNKCSSCRPCEATLVIPPHLSSHDKAAADDDDQQFSHREDDTYYLLSWKCRCGNKFYQP